jgi:hypothetical protein
VHSNLEEGLRQGGELFAGISSSELTGVMEYELNMDLLLRVEVLEQTTTPKPGWLTFVLDWLYVVAAGVKAERSEATPLS